MITFWKFKDQNEPKLKVQGPKLIFWKYRDQNEPKVENIGTKMNILKVQRPKWIKSIGTKIVFKPKVKLGLLVLARA